MVTTIIILSIFLIISIYANINLIRKNEVQEEDLDENEKYLSQLTEWVSSFYVRINMSYEQMQQLDQKGAFESDDEVGHAFTQIKEIIEELQQLTKQTQDGGSTEEETR